MSALVQWRVIVLITFCQVRRGLDVVYKVGMGTANQLEFLVELLVQPLVNPHGVHLDALPAGGVHGVLKVVRLVGVGLPVRDDNGHLLDLGI